MAKPGPAPKPTALKVVKGNPGKRPLPKNEPKYEAVVKIPTPPSWLSKEGKAHYKRLATRLVKANVLTTNDTESLAILADAYATFIYAQKEIQKKGATVGGVKSQSKLNPYLSIADKAWLKIKALTPEFGMTPASRTRIETLPEGSEGDGDGWDEF